MGRGSRALFCSGQQVAIACGFWYSKSAKIFEKCDVTDVTLLALLRGVACLDSFYGQRPPSALLCDQIAQRGLLQRSSAAAEAVLEWNSDQKVHCRRDGGSHEIPARYKLCLSLIPTHVSLAGCIDVPR